MDYRMCDYIRSHCFILGMLVGKGGEVTFQTADIYTDIFGFAASLLYQLKGTKNHVLKNNLKLLFKPD